MNAGEHNAYMRRTRLGRNDGPFYEGHMAHLNYLDTVIGQARATILSKEGTYKGSWKRRGGTGIFHVALGRKWDRLEAGCEGFEYDVLAFLDEHPDRIDDVEDLCNYLLLLQSEILRRKNEGKPMRAG